MTEKETQEKEISNDLKDLVMARLELLSSDKRVSIGSDGKEYSKQELIEQVKNGTDIGKKIIDVELTFLKALKDGVLLEEILTDN